MKPAVVTSDAVPRTVTVPGMFSEAGPLTKTRSAVIVRSEPVPATRTAAPSVMSPSSAPDAVTFVVAVVVTVTGWPPAVLMTTLLPFTCSSVPSARAASRVVTGGEGCCADVPARIVHL